MAAKNSRINELEPKFDMVRFNPGGMITESDRDLFFLPQSYWKISPLVCALMLVANRNVNGNKQIIAKWWTSVFDYEKWNYAK
jgi:hypothetical protein